MKVFTYTQKLVFIGVLTIFSSISVMGSNPPEQQNKQTVATIDLNSLPPLFKAAVAGDVAGITQAVKDGNSVDSAIPDGYFAGFTPLLVACMLGKLDSIKCLAENGANLNYLISQPGRFKDASPVQVARLFGRTDSERCLVALGASYGAILSKPMAIPQDHGHGSTMTVDFKVLNPIFFAVVTNDIKTMKQLFQNGTALNIRVPKGSGGPIQGFNLLHLASFFGATDSIKYLVAEGMKIDKPVKKRGEYYGYGALQIAARLNSVKTLQCLRDCGADLRSVSDRGRLAGVPLISVAAFFGKLHAVQYLEQFINLNDAISSGDYIGLSPLYIAVENNDVDLFSFLLRHYYANDIGKVSTIKTGKFKGFHLIHLAARLGSIDIINMLIDQFHANVNLQVESGDFQGYTSLHLAVQPNLVQGQRNLIDTIDCLIMHGADVNQPAGDGIFDGLRPIHMAAEAGNIPVLEHFVGNYNIDVNSRAIGPWDGYTPVFSAVRRNAIAAIDWLVNHGAGLNTPMVSSINHLDGATPLVQAARFGNLPVIKYFDQNGVDLNQEAQIKCFRGFKLIHFAAHRGDCDTVRYLISRGGDIDEPANAEGEEYHNWRPIFFALENMQNPKEIVKFFSSLGASMDSPDGRSLVDLLKAKMRCHACAWHKTGRRISASQDMGTPWKAAYKYASTTALKNRQLLTLCREGSITVDGITRILDQQTVRELIMQGADNNICDRQGNTPLHYLIRNFNPAAPTVYDECAYVLIGQKVNINPVNKCGDTPLSAASRYGNTRMIAALLTGGADPMIGNNLVEAAVQHNSDVVRRLVAYAYAKD